MKFLVDAQLPYGLARFIRSKGHDVIHTDDLPNKERTSDRETRENARAEERIVISKDKDFHESHILQKEPDKLLFHSTGNIVNRELLLLFESNWEDIEKMFQHYDLLELTNTQLIAYGPN